MTNQLNDDANPVILFDGVCKFCDASVNFVIDHDQAKRFRFAALQSDSARPYLQHCQLPSDFLDGAVLVDCEKCYTKSTAALKILKEIDGFYFLLYPLILVPRSLRDWVYDRLVRYRYRWFGKLDQCRVPAEVEDRFLDAAGR